MFEVKSSRLLVDTIKLNPSAPPRFATELAGRKARRRSWKGLADEMARAGWFDNN